MKYTIQVFTDAEMNNDEWVHIETVETPDSRDIFAALEKTYTEYQYCTGIGALFVGHIGVVGYNCY